ncbi:MAG TPA: glucoamylase family protein [Terriglobales bacterium]|nr:glucoamylase family protein [Terriglobales bacterium]
MAFPSDLTRREFLRLFQTGALTLPLAWLPTCSTTKRSTSGGPSTKTDEQLLDEIQHASFDFFWNEASPATGQVKDRALAAGSDTRTIASIASTGFALSALCIADSRGYKNTADIKERVRTTLRYLANQLPQEHGFFYHFVDMNTGARAFKSELSSVDTTILLCGVLTARQYFSDTEIQELATTIYNRVDWAWMLNGGETLSMGWTPESGFLDGRWNHYSELMMIYLLAIGSPTHPIPAASWEAWTRPTITYQGITYISGNDPLFTHQYSHAWFDFRNVKDAHANYFENSINATKAHKLFCLSLRDKFSDYADDLWGITASDYFGGYTAWGGPPPQGPLDGSIVPCATGGSLPFVFDDCMRVLRNIRTKYTGAWARYGFVDAFNPLTGWYDPDVIGIDVGITMLMAENHRTGLVWQTFMKNPEAISAMKLVGFKAA